jgi:dolichyl-phosphate-mannose-protein mannosyltransferase
MTRLLLLQLLFFALGAAALPVLGIARDRSQLLARLPLAYVVGIAVAGIVTAHLALLGAAVGATELVVLTVLLAPVAWRRLRGRRGDARSPRIGWLGAAAILLALVLLGHLVWMLETRPLYEWDGWAIWATKARALYDFGGAYAPVFTSYPPVQHPLLLPALESIDFRVLGRFDGTLVHVQLGCLGFAFAAGLWTLLRERVPAALAGVTVLALVSATGFVHQLSTNYADVPLAIFVALGAVSLARWLVEGDGSLAAASAVFLGAATLTKPEGLLFAVAAFLAALAAGGRARLRGTALTALAVALILLPWLIFVAKHHLKNPEYSLGNAVNPAYLWDHADRLGPAFRSIAGHAFSLDWGLLVPLALVSLVAAFLGGRPRLALFAGLWTLLSFLGIVLVFWISVVPVELTLRWAAYRTVASLVVGAAALAPLLAADAWKTSLVRGRSREDATVASRTRAPSSAGSSLSAGDA